MGGIALSDRAFINQIYTEKGKNMEFLKELFTEPLSFEAFEKAVNAKGFKLADLSSGNYVAKDKFDKANNDLKTAQDSVKTITEELQGLKDKNATAEDWKAKFEQLQADNAEKEKQAKEQKEAEEKARNIEARYNAICVDKDGKPLEFTHDAIKASYLQKFTEALADETNTGKSDADIFHALTKDDATAFKTVQPDINIPGAKQLGGNLTQNDFAKMNYMERAKLYSENQTLYNELKGE